MCTAVSWKAGRHYFGRNLDLEGSYGEHIAVVPRRMPLKFHSGEILETHYALAGTAHIAGGYPLFYDGMNERGLCIAGLSFSGYARYTGGRDGIACYEVLPALLSRCASAAEAAGMLRERGISAAAFNEKTPPSPLHFLIADGQDCLVAEPMADGIHIHENPVGVLTNNPPFEFQRMNLNNYLNLTPRAPESRFSENAALQAYSRGMGAIGLPGDYSSQSRFVRAAFVKCNSPLAGGSEGDLMQFFHILGSVAMPAGSVILENGMADRTIYSACCDAEKGAYYYKTYENSLVHCVDMRRENLDSRRLIAYPMIDQCHIRIQNENPEA